VGQGDRLQIPENPCGRLLVMHGKSRLVSPRSCQHRTLDPNGQISKTFNPTKAHVSANSDAQLRAEITPLGCCSRSRRGRLTRKRSVISDSYQQLTLVRVNVNLQAPQSTLFHRTTQRSSTLGRQQPCSNERKRVRSAKLELWVIAAYFNHVFSFR
jgi:hypothetical protein